MKSLKFPLRGLCLAMGLVATGAHASALEGDLKHLLDQHPAIKAAKLAAGSSEKRIDVAKAAFKPKVTLTADTGREMLDNTSYRPDGDSRPGYLVMGNSGTLPQVTASDLIRRKKGLTVEQNLYNGGKREAALQVSEKENTLQQLNLDIATQDVLLEGLSAYLQVGRYLTLIGLAKLNEQTTRDQLELETKRLEGGGGIAVDVLQARTRLQVVRERRVFYEQGLRDALANYEQVFGRPPDLNNFQELKPFEARLPNSVMIAMARGMEQSSRLKAASTQVERAAILIDLEKAGFLPTLDLIGMRNRDINANQLALREETSLLLRMNWVLYSGMDTTAKAAAAEKDRDELLERENVAKNKTREAIRISWNQLANGAERLELLDNAAAISFDVMQNRKRLRDSGKETALNVLDAEVEYFGVLANKVNALYDTRIGSYRLLYHMGDLTPENVGLLDRFALPVAPLTVDLDKIAQPVKR